MIRQKGNSWFVRWRESGVQKQRHFGVGPAAKTRAELYEAEIKLAKKRGVDPLKNVHQNGRSFADISQLYIDHLRATGRSEAHIKNMIILLNNLFIPKMPEGSASNISFEDVLTFAGNFADRAQSTRNRYMDYINAIFNFAVSHKLLEGNPMSNWKKPKEAKRDVQLKIDDLSKIMAAAEPHLAWGIEFAFNTGVRTGESELLALEWKNVDFDKGEIKVYAPKTRTYRIVPVNQGFLGRLREQMALATCSRIIEYRGAPVKSLRRSFRTACDRAGIDFPVRFYDLRHLFCSTLLSNGADLAAVSKIMGHAALSTTTDNYYHLQKGEKERAVGLLPSMSPGLR